MNSHTSEAALIVFGLLIWIGVHHLQYAEFGIVARFLRPRNFSPIIAAQMRLTTLQEDLAVATTTDARWLAVRSASADLGFNQLCMKVDGQFYEERFAQTVSRQQQTCTIRIPLSSTEFINIGHDFTCATAPMIMAPLASILYSGLERKASLVASTPQERETPAMIAFENAS